MIQAETSIPRGPGASSWLTQARALATGAELWVVLFITGTAYLFSRNFYLFSARRPEITHLGAEYYNVAFALTHGHGYGSPFGADTGPTAWTMPLFTYLLAGLLLAFGKKILVARAVVWLTIAAHAAIGLSLFRMAKQLRARVSPLAIVGLYLLWLWAFYDWFFLMTHDVWLLELLVCVIAVALLRYAVTGEVRRWRWGVLGGLSALSSPALVLGWMGTSVFMAWRTPHQKKRLLVSLAVAACLAAPWSVRNAWSFHRFIPTKSNLFYEAYIANYQDDDGIHDCTFVGHPFNSTTSRAEYGRLGETTFIEQHKAKFLASLLEDPARYARNVFNRLLAVTVDYVPCKNAIDSPPKRAVQYTLYAVPFLALTAFFSMRGGSHPFALTLTAFSVVYLLPYIFVSFYLRYMMPLSPILILFAFIGIDRLTNALTGSNHENR